MSHNEQSGKFFISMVDFPWLPLLRIFFSSTGLKSLESLSFELQIHFSVDSVRFFSRSYLTLNNKTHFKFLHPIAREPNNLEKQKKKKIEAEWCNFYKQPSEFTNTHFYKIFFQVSDLVKNAKKRRS